jgi:hypothetical protein
VYLDKLADNFSFRGLWSLFVSETTVHPAE